MAGEMSEMQISIAAQAAALNAQAIGHVREAFAIDTPEFKMTLEEFIEEADQAGHYFGEAVPCAFCETLKERLLPIVQAVSQQGPQ